MKKTYIIGHKKPDTDAVVAAMALEYLYNEAECFCHENAQAVITDPLNPETRYLFDKFGVKTPQLITAEDIAEDDRVVLVDHNEESQRLDGLNEDQIVEVIDHHKANINFGKPIYMTFKTWGSSCAIVYYIMKQNSVRPEKTLASLMLAAILSDTVGYKSATVTDNDKKYGEELAKIAEIHDVAGFTREIFKAKSDISSLSDEEIVKNDYKIFEFETGGENLPADSSNQEIKKVMIDQLETVEQDVVLFEKKQGLLAAMAAVKTELGVELLFVAITDILEVNTKLLILSDTEREVAEAAFGGKVQDNVLDIGPKMSRKKEIAPAIEKAINK